MARPRIQRVASPDAAEQKRRYDARRKRQSLGDQLTEQISDESKATKKKASTKKRSAPDAADDTKDES